MTSKFVRWCCGLLLLAVAVGFVAAWQWRARTALAQWDPDRARSANQPIPVRTVKVNQRDLVETIGGTGVTLPVQSATIAIPLNSTTIADRVVKSVCFQPGSPVNKGDMIFEFEPLLFEQTVNQREAMLDKARTELKTLDNLHQQKAASGLELKQAEVAVETAKLELSLAKEDLALCVVNSPLNGVVESVNVVPQMRVGGGTTLAVIHQLDPIIVQMDYPMERMDSLKVGQAAEVVLDAFPQETFEGKVVRILPVVSTKTRVLPVMVEVANPDNRIRAGISGFVRVRGERSSATIVPSVAVIKKERKAMVFCVEENRARIREVLTGPMKEAGSIEILAGLHAGDEVIVYGQDAVQEDDLVNANWHQWARR
ncbi:MAG TPA: efflux RND transporter periplasmic adaptor subunit [Lacipirellulaceae bacterium]|jgi:membrane fusion protein (multidrug efflux system)|nr:efflux RND transporter periplasmic adaptor subunit [Lacipirellulaceae bacterium]